MGRPAGLTVESYEPDGESRQNRTDLARIGRLVKILRERYRWRQTDLAARARVAPNTVTGLESGRRTQRKSIEKIAVALGTTAASLSRGEIPEWITGSEFLAIQLKGLNDEDFAIARLYHEGSTAKRTAVLELLEADWRDANDRIARLTEAQRAAILEAIKRFEETNSPIAAARER